MSITFEITAGPSAGQRFWLRLNQSLSIGRSHEADYPLPADAQLSSVHLRVGLDGRGGWVEDLQSTNGTSVNDQKIAARTPLSDGDRISVGHTVLTVRLTESLTTTPLRTLPIPATPIPALPTPAQHIPASPTGTHDLGTPDVRHPSTRASVSSTSPVATPIAVATPAVAGRPADVSSVDVNRSSGSGLAAVVDADDGVLAVLRLEVTYAGHTALLPWVNARDEARLTVIHKVTWCYGDQGTLSLDPQQVPIWTEDQAEDDQPLAPVRCETDRIPFKPRADVVVVGHVHAPGGQPATHVECELRVGGVGQRLRVWGDRQWSFPTAVQLVPRIVGPAPFTRMPITYRRAFGGFDAEGGTYCPENLAGTGFLSSLAPQSIHHCRLPNFEYPDQPITQFDSRVRPAGFGFWGRGWQPRLQYALAAVQNRGTMPDYEFFNGAPRELQVDGYLKGGETVTLVNLSRAGTETWRLPVQHPRLTVHRYRGTEVAGAHLVCSSAESQIPPRLDTLILFPDERRCCLVYRAVFGLPSLDDIDIGLIRVT